MKKKVAVFANGWNSENLAHYMKGLRDGLAGSAVDPYVFLGHDAFGLSQEGNKSEICIYNLPDLHDFDGAVLVVPGMDFGEVNDGIITRCREAGIPFVTVGARIDGAISIYTDNYKGMRFLIDHLIMVHKVRNILFIAGPKDSEDSNERLRAVFDSCRENGVDFSEDDVLYANWDVFLATNYMRDHYSHGEPLPDVIMCANDNTAFYISFVLEEAGIMAPRDFLLTGFDGTYKAATFYPALTTVAQPFNEMGKKTADCFLKIFKGEIAEDEYYIPCTFVQGESCGCDNAGISDELRRQMCRIGPREAVLTGFRTGRIHFMENAVLKSKRYSTLGTCLQEYFYDRDDQEGNPFYIFIDPEFARLGECRTDELPKHEFSGIYDMIVGKHGDRHYPLMRTDIRKHGLIPEEDDEGHMYVFMPLYVESFICGYMVMTDNTDFFKEAKFFTFGSALNRILETYRKNLELSALNDRLSELLNKDPMTGVKNRVAYESFKSILNEKMAAGQLKNMAFVMFDINDLKVINDTYGHEKGDEYIRNSCDLICRIYCHSMVFRMGGDEFLAILKDREYENRNILLYDFRNEIKSIASSDLLPEKRISVASGMAIYDRDIDESVDSVIKRADDEMYKNKRMIKDNG